MLLSCTETQKPQGKREKPIYAPPTSTPTRKDLSVFEFSRTSESATEVAMLTPEALQLWKIWGVEAGGDKVETARVPNTGGVSCCPAFPENCPGLRRPAVLSPDTSSRRQPESLCRTGTNSRQGNRNAIAQRKRGLVSNIPESGIPRLHTPPPPIYKLTVEGVGLRPQEWLSPTLRNSYAGEDGKLRGRRSQYSPLSSGSGCYFGSVAATRSSST